MKEDRPVDCPICRTRNTSPLYFLPPRRLVRCRSCGHEYVDPIPASILNPTHVSGGGFVDQLPAYEVRWRLGDLAAGERRTLTWQGTVDPYIELDLQYSANTAAKVAKTITHKDLQDVDRKI